MSHIPRRYSSGLVAVLLLFAIVGILAAVLIYNSLGNASKRFNAAQAGTTSFQKIGDAFARYVMLNQRLPCPASGTANTGDADPNAATVTCNSPAGVVPWNTLGLDKTDAIDPWGRYVWYRVYDGATGFTRANGLAMHNCLDETTTTTYALSGAGSTCNSTTHENSISDFLASKGLTVNDMGTAKSGIAYVLISPGETGYGGFYPGGTSAVTPPSASSKEFLNAGSGGTYWITAPSTGVAPGDATHFDDVLSYATALDVAKTARVAGRPWPLSTTFTHTDLGVTTSNYNTGVSSLKVAVSGGPVMVTAAADTTQKVCGLSSTPEGAAPCTTQTNGNNLLVTTNNERLTFDFRVSRRYAVVQLTEFRASGGGDNERAIVTFFNAAGTQVDQQTVTACATSGSNRIGHYTLTAAADFTKIEVRGTTKTGGGNSDLGVAAIMACKLSTDCPTWSSSNPTVNYPAGWTQPVC